MKKEGLGIFNLQNELLQAQIIQAAFVGFVYLFFGEWITLHFLCAAIMGILLLETVSYIEHYGLQRKSTSANSFERTMQQHSWNSNCAIGRILLFELSRHSDHHYLASRTYQKLKHYYNTPQLPTGYPGSMLLALLPPLWCKLINQRVLQYEINNGEINTSKKFVL